MRKLFKRVISFVLIPFTKWYLRKERYFRYRDIAIVVHPGVFHPGLFYSTKFLLEFLDGRPLPGKKFLELGCGTGTIAVVAARAGAVVTASDLSLKAIENTKLNAQNNHVNIRIVHSDLFDALEIQVFDAIIINPPYYSQIPKNEEELAWNCGENFEYFWKLFSTIDRYINSDTEIIVVLTKGCDLKSIFTIAAHHNFSFILLREKAVLFDGRDFLYQLKKTTSFP